MASDPNAKTRIRIAFLFLFVFVIALSVGAYFIADLSKLQESIAARESRTALQGMADSGQIDEAIRQHPANKFLQLVAMATRAANETSAAAEKLAGEIEPPAISGAINLGAASRSDLEGLRRNLRTAEANATAFLPNYVALLKTERDKVEKYALSAHIERDTVGRLLGNLDKRHAEITAFASSMSSARADYYRAYANYVAVLVEEFGSYKVVDGQFIFPFQRTVDRYNIAGHAMTVAAKRVAELEDERKRLLKSQQEGWERLVDGK